MEVCRTFDLAEIWAILSVKEISEAVFEDDVGDITTFVPSVIDEIWLKVHQNHQIIGLYRFHRMTSICLQVHAHILPKFRKKYSLHSAKLALAWVIKDVVGLQKIIAYCPEKYKNVYAFLKKFGFEDEGFNRESWRVGGKIYGQYLLGLTKSEFGAAAGEKTWET